MIGDYTFTLNGQACKPIYSDDLKKLYALRNDEAYYDVSLNGNIILVNEDFDYVMSQPFETRFLFNIYLNGKLYFESTFLRTHCTENWDDRTLKIGLTYVDSTEAILNAYDKEHDILALHPKQESITMFRRPLLQLYAAGTSELYNIAGSDPNRGTENVWTQPVNNPTWNYNILEDTYKFKRSYRAGELFLEPTGATATPEIRGSWTHSLIQNDMSFSKEDANYYIDWYLQTTTGGRSIYTFHVVHAVTKKIQFKPLTESSFVGDLFEFTTILRDVDNINDQFKVKGWMCELYYRTIAARVPGEDTPHITEYSELPENDFVERNRNYRWVYNESATMLYMVRSNEVSATPTGWGRSVDGDYFVKPATSPGDTFFPLLQNLWMGTSLWMRASSTLTLIQPFIHRDACVLSDVIDLLLKQINPAYIFNESQSKFLYGNLELGPGLYYQRLSITQKTNILRDGYDQAAQRGELSLKNILDMLWQLFQCRWHMSNNRLYIEHISYYKNGMSYQGIMPSDIDLTATNHARHNLPMTFGKTTYTYDNESLVEEMNYSYTDSVSSAFKPITMKVISVYVEPGKREDVSIGVFNPDVDFMLLNSNEVSNDGFALFLADIVDGQYELSFQKYIQNGALRLEALMELYFLHDLPSAQVMLDDTLWQAKGVRRTKKQEIWFTYAEDPNPYSLIKTQAGYGQIEKMEINLTSRRVNLTLKYDTH